MHASNTQICVKIMHCVLVTVCVHERVSCDCLSICHVCVCTYVCVCVCKCAFAYVLENADGESVGVVPAEDMYKDNSIHDTLSSFRFMQ